MNTQKLSKADKCRNLRYKRPELEELGYNTIMDTLQLISEECYEIHWAYDDDETLINAFDGNEEDAYEFKWMFSDLEAEAERLSEATARCLSTATGLISRKYPIRSCGEHAAP